MNTITKFECGFSNSALAIPYALARLDCGHCTTVVLKPRRGTCYRCNGPEQEVGPNGATCAACGGRVFTITYSPNPHNVADRVTSVGDVVECEHCAKLVKQYAWLQELNSHEVHHARYKEFCGVGAYLFYRLDRTSPSNFFLIGSVEATPAVDALLDAKRICALSPTEAA